YAEILDDHFLNVAVTLLEITDGEQCVYTVCGRFANADQNASSKWNALFACFLNSAQTLGRYFVRGMVVGLSWRQQRLIGCLEHKAHAGRYRREPGNPLGAHHSRIGMREQACFAQNQLAHSFQIMKS